MGAPRKADWREERRKRAWQLKEQGWQQKDIATVLGVSEGAVSPASQVDTRPLFGDQWHYFGRALVHASPPRSLRCGRHRGVSAGATAQDPWENPAESPMARRSIERKRSRTFSSEGPRNGCS